MLEHHPLGIKLDVEPESSGVKRTAVEGGGRRYGQPRRRLAVAVRQDGRHYFHGDVLPVVAGWKGLFNPPGPADFYSPGCLGRFDQDLPCRESVLMPTRRSVRSWLRLQAYSAKPITIPLVRLAKPVKVPNLGDVLLLKTSWGFWRPVALTE